MLNFQDSLVSRLSEEQFVRIQLENLMEVMVNKVQDQVCNELGALSCEPVGLGTRLIEKPVWGIDSHTVKTIQLILEDYYWRNIRPSAYSSASSPAQGTGTAETAPALAPPSAPDRFTIEEYKKFLERTLLPTINSVPTSSAHSMKYVLETIIEVSSLPPPPSLLCSALLCLPLASSYLSAFFVHFCPPLPLQSSTKCPELHKEYSQLLLSTFPEVDPNIYFRIHPKGTGVICIDPQGIPPHTVIARYLGELYPPYRWCEKLDAIQQAQQNYELKPTLPDFYNILLERPRKDQRGYGLVPSPLLLLCPVLSVLRLTLWIGLIFVDASQRANLGSSCSHSCDANCTSAIVACNGKLSIVLTTVSPFSSLPPPSPSLPLPHFI
jgi:hypothetical protein